MIYDAALKICDRNSGLNSLDVLDLFNRVHSLQVYPINIEPERLSVAARGFLSPETACHLQKPVEELTQFITRILIGAEPTTEDHTYHYKSLTIYIS